MNQLMTTVKDYFLCVRHNISVPGTAPETARAVIDAADKLCPYSNATRGNIDVTFNLVRGIERGVSSHAHSEIVERRRP